MGSKSRESIYGASARASAEHAAEARRQADKLACEAWNKRMLAFQGPAQPCGAPIRQDRIETSAKSEVVTVCSWQFAGEERLQSKAMILITTGEPRRYDGQWGR
jgi:hypothetical protein